MSDPLKPVSDTQAALIRLYVTVHPLLMHLVNADSIKRTVPINITRGQAHRLRDAINSVYSFCTQYAGPTQDDEPCTDCWEPVRYCSKCGSWYHSDGQTVCFASEARCACLPTPEGEEVKPT